jgi:tRNA(fMet)-specific endonuclease VapC
VPVLAELVFGIERSQSRNRNMQRLKAALPSLNLWPFDPAAAFEFGRVHAERVSVGRPMQVVDMMIAAIAFVLGNCTLVSKDSDLAAVPGLTVENWVV